MHDTHPFYHRRPLVIAHRGASGSAPENTLAAFQAALEAGADGIELDVTRCGTGEIVVIHDDTVDRTTNGSGVVSTMSLWVLRELDAGAWFGPEYAGERVPLLSEVLDAVGSSLRINIEIKARRRRSDGLEQEVAAMVRERGLQDRVLISSFNPFALRHVRREAPELQLGLLFGPPSAVPLVWSWARPWVGATALHPRAADIDAAWVQRTKERGYRVNVWTVNDPDAMRRVVEAGVDGVITDHPAMLRAILDGRETGELARTGAGRGNT